MALLFIDSFDHYVTADLLTKYLSLGSFAPSISAGNGRHSSACVRSNAASATSYVSKGVPASGTTAIIGMAFKTSSLQASFISVLDGGDAQIYGALNSDGSITIYRSNSVLLFSAGTALGSTAAGVLTVDVFNFIELKVVLHDSTGAVTLKVNGITVLSLTGQDTRYSAGTGGWTQFVVGRSSGSHNIDIDDLYVCDGSGAVNNDFLGDVRVDAHFPNAAGTNNASTPSTGGDRSATVDETAPNGDTDYNTLTAAGDKDTYNLEAFKATGSAILGMQVLTSIKKTDAGVGSSTTVVRHSGTDYDGTTQGLTLGYTYVRDVYNVNPGTNAQMLEADFNALEVGPKRVS